MSASCFHKRILFLCFSHITSKTCESVAPGFTQPSYSFLSCSSVIATTIRLISWGMFTTVPHLSAGGLVKGKDAQLSPLLFWRCSRIINVIQQRLSLFFLQQCCGKQSPAAVDSAVCSQCIPCVPMRKHIVSEFTANWYTISICSVLVGLDKPLAVPDGAAYFCRPIRVGTFKAYVSQITLLSVRVVLHRGLWKWSTVY